MQQEFLALDAERDRQSRNYGSTIFEHGMRWRHWQIKRKTRRIRYCHTTTANAPGCYLTFIETITGKRAKHETIWVHKTRREAKAYAYKQY